jgi:hypothetical protein
VRCIAASHRLTEFSSRGLLGCWSWRHKTVRNVGILPQHYTASQQDLDLNLHGRKVKLSLCFNWTPRHEGVLGEWMYSSTHSLTSALEGGEWSASRPGCFTPGGPQSRSGRSTRRESNPDRPARSPALYRLSYHGSSSWPWKPEISHNRGFIDFAVLSSRFWWKTCGDGESQVNWILFFYVCNSGYKPIQPMT